MFWRDIVLLAKLLTGKDKCHAVTVLPNRSSVEDFNLPCSTTPTVSIKNHLNKYKIRVRISTCCVPLGYFIVLVYKYANDILGIQINVPLLPRPTRLLIMTTLSLADF